MLKELAKMLRAGWWSSKGPPPRARPFLAQANAIAPRYPFPIDVIEEALECDMLETEIDALLSHGLALNLGATLLLRQARNRRQNRDKLFVAIRRIGIQVVTWHRTNRKEDAGWVLGTHANDEGMVFTVLDEYFGVVVARLRQLEPGDVDGGRDVLTWTAT